MDAPRRAAAAGDGPVRKPMVGLVSQATPQNYRFNLRRTFNVIPLP